MVADCQGFRLLRPYARLNIQKNDICFDFSIRLLLVLYNLRMESLFIVPTIPNRTKIPQAAIQNVVDQIIGLIQPQKIILFGSYAYGQLLYRVE